MQQLNDAGYRSIYFTDDHFLLKRKRINEICQGIIDNLCLTHGHMDHAAGVAYYLSQRHFVGNSPGRVTGIGSTPPG